MTSDLLKNFRRCLPSRLFAIQLAVLLLLAGHGCEDEQYQTVAGLQEENSVLKQRIQTLEQEKADLQIDRKTGDTATASALHETIAQLEERLVWAEADKQTAIADAQLRHRTTSTLLEKQIATLRLELGGVQRERLALREIVDREPRLRDATAVRASSAHMTMFVLLLGTCALLVWMAGRYRTTRERLNMLAMQSVSELRFLGGAD